MSVEARQAPERKLREINGRHIAGVSDPTDVYVLLSHIAWQEELIGKLYVAANRVVEDWDTSGEFSPFVTELSVDATRAAAEAAAEGVGE